MKNENLKPVIIDNIKGNNSYYRGNEYAQNLLLKALSEGITDVNELRKIAGFKAASEVYQTLDKLKIRKGYHTALQSAGMDLDFIVGKLKGLCGDETSDKVKLGALQTVLKSIGLDKYEKEEESGKNWEELILELSEEKGKKKLAEGELAEDEEEYEVITPKLPDEVKKRQAEEKKASEGLYD